jgi:hypothetical protein
MILRHKKTGVTINTKDWEEVAEELDSNLSWDTTSLRDWLYLVRLGKIHHKIKNGMRAFDLLNDYRDEIGRDTAEMIFIDDLIITIDNKGIKGFGAKSKIAFHQMNEQVKNKK